MPTCRTPLLNLHSTASFAQYRPGESIYRDGAPVDCWYAVIDGAACLNTVTGEGRRHIVSFQLPGELFGFGAEGRHQFCAEALTSQTIVARYPRVVLETLAQEQPAIGTTLRQAAFDCVGRLQRRMVLLGRPRAIEKVSGFLVEMLGRYGDSNWTVRLPMSRYDIADYLALAVETVSRALTILRCRGVISVEGGKRVRILDRPALEAFSAGCAREGVPHGRRCARPAGGVAVQEH